ncbi:MAG: class I SAM-dependent methyltransferase [Nocardioidaceae bacterium]|nr:class I SAM-dependent methyltransferase [Nocardioidaceae bacterium]
MTTTVQQGSSSLEQPDYWWYRARAALLHAALGDFLGTPGLVLDVGSADGPSVGWMRGQHRRIAIDLDPRGLRAGEGVCASALALPFADSTFDVVAAFDVVEHCEPETTAVAELARVLKPGGRLLMSVPAYQWAWSDHDVRAGHYRRYTRPRALAAVATAGLVVRRSTYAFAGVFPFFVAERLVRRARPARKASPPETTGLTRVPRGLDAVLMGLSRLECRRLRHHDLPFGSSVFLAADKPQRAEARP